MYRNRPRTLPLPVIDRPEMVWPCPSKVPPEGGNGGKIHAGQINVRLQIDRLPLGPAVQGTVPGEFRQIFRRTEVDGTDALSRQSGWGNERENQNRRQKEAQNFTDVSVSLSFEASLF